MSISLSFEIEGKRYEWRHHSCKCMCHCNDDELYIDGEFYGSVTNPALCELMFKLHDRLGFPHGTSL